MESGSHRAAQKPPSASPTVHAHSLSWRPQCRLRCSAHAPRRSGRFRRALGPLFSHPPMDGAESRILQHPRFSDDTSPLKQTSNVQEFRATSVSPFNRDPEPSTRKHPHGRFVVLPSPTHNVPALQPRFSLLERPPALMRIESTISSRHSHSHRAIQGRTSASRRVSPCSLSA